MTWNSYQVHSFPRPVVDWVQKVCREGIIKFWTCRTRFWGLVVWLLYLLDSSFRESEIGQKSGFENFAVKDMKFWKFWISRFFDLSKNTDTSNLFFSMKGWYVGSILVSGSPKSSKMSGFENFSWNHPNFENFGFHDFIWSEILTNLVSGISNRLLQNVARVHKNMQDRAGGLWFDFCKLNRILASGSPEIGQKSAFEQHFRDIKILFHLFENFGFQDFLISRKTPNFKLVFLYERLVICAILVSGSPKSSKNHGFANFFVISKFWKIFGFHYFIWPEIRPSTFVSATRRVGTKVARVHKNMQNALGACGLTFVPRILASGSPKSTKSPDLEIFRDIKSLKILKILDFKIFWSLEKHRTSNLFFSMKGWYLAILVSGSPKSSKSPEIWKFFVISKILAAIFGFHYFLWSGIRPSTFVSATRRIGYKSREGS